MNILQLFKPITTFIFDVDGVLTDGTIIVLNDGQQARQMNIKDGYALQLAIKKGYGVVIISGSFSNAVKDRLEKLGISNIFLGIKNKKEKLSEYINYHKLHWKEVLFMGDDMPDYTSMQLTGLSCCPADAVSEIKQISKYISPYQGGRGCVRDVIEKTLKLNGHWDLDTTIASK